MGIGRTPRTGASLSKRMSVNPVQMAAIDAKFKTAEQLQEQAAAAPGTEAEAQVGGWTAGRERLMGWARGWLQ